MFSSACSFSVKIDVSKSLCPFQGTFLASVRAFLEWCPSHGPFWTGCLPYRFSWSPTSLFTSYMCLFPWKAVTLKQCNCTADIFNWYLTPLLSFPIRHRHKQPILPPASAWARMGMLHQRLAELGSQLGWTFGGKQAHDSFEPVSPTQNGGIFSDLLTARAGQTDENHLEMQPGSVTYSSWQGTTTSLSQASSLLVVAARQPQLKGRGYSLHYI